jgi:PKD repeat protein
LLRRTLPSAFVSVLMLWFLAPFDYSQAADIEINITETITVSDSVATQPSAWIEVSEPVTVSDAVSVEPDPVVQINVSEAITVADSVDTRPSVMITVSEAVGVSDSVGTQPSAWIEVSEPVTVSDSINIDIYPVVDISISETVSVTDSITIRPSVMIDVSESVSVTDIVDAEAFFFPIANAGAPYIGVEGLPLSLDGSGSIDPDGSIVLYEWDVDNDGTYEYSSSSPVQIHTYSYESIYTIRLRVTDDSGFVDEAITYAYVLDSSPTADFTGFPTDGTPPLTVNFINYSDGYDQPLSYEWDFDNDGTVDSTLPEPSYEYPLGVYSVKLIVTDSDGSTSTLLRTNYVASCLSPVRITATPPLYYFTIQSAYDDAYDGEVIQSRDKVFTENITIDGNIDVYFEGGFNCDYSTNGGVTVIKGNISLNDGKLIIDSGSLEVR